ncbi:voltage-dependent calcium channel [Entomortierella parvispora]|uniref:Calcium-channel protein CCH1 n=1 Tax=Entomortierella parvispora TaxID=205924 RepID=A0A9P3H522_9FUNG|nr:voltage-dependent calcium channel [Entomortierella parvispora]
MPLGRTKYESLRHSNQSNDPDNDPSFDPTVDSRGAAWASLARTESDRSTSSDFELGPLHDRTGLTLNFSPPYSDQSQEDLLGASSFLQPPTTPTRRNRGFHHNHSSNISIHSSAKSARSSARLASMKDALGRASTRVMNLSGSSSKNKLPPPPTPEIASVYSKAATENEDDESQDEDEDMIRANQDSNVQGKLGTHKGSSATIVPPEAQPPSIPMATQQPLEGYSLFIFGPNNRLRLRLNDLLNQTWIELSLLVLLVLNLIFLVLMVSSPKGSDTIWGAHWTDYGLLVIFILYTLELGSRIIVSGLILFPKDGEKVRKYFGKRQRTDNLHDTNPTILRKSPNAVRRETMLAPSSTMAHTHHVTPAATFKPIYTATPSSTMRPAEQTAPLQSTTTATTRATTIIDFAVGRQTTMTQFIPTYMDPLVAYKPQFIAATGTQIPFLRHTFNRIDFLAVLCYWIDFCLMMAGVQHVYFFKTIAAMRTLRLLNITAGSATILHSLKKSAPLLVNIALFIAFFFIIFSIIGVQAFKGSLSRRCVSATNATDILEDQFCGGYYNLTDPTRESSYIQKDGEPSPTSPKGRICSHGYVCLDTGVNLDGAISFDVIYSAMVPVYVLMTGQTWTDLMYYIMDAEYSWSSLYFVLVVMVMNFWILNLFIAVINEMFAKIRDDSAQNSAFTSDNKDSNKNNILNDSVNNFTFTGNNMFSRRKAWVESLEFVWVLAIVADLVFQCLPRYNSPPSKLELIDRAELWFTVAFAVDIFIRFLVCFPRPGEFFDSKKNLVDLTLAITTLIIQIPYVHNSHVYVYLTVFQVVRIYRVIIYVERLRSLIQRVVGSWIGLLNLIFFIAMFLVVVSVMAGILFREIVDPTSTPMNFSDFYVSYLAMYQLFSGENWTDILYNVITSEIPWGQVVIATVFIIAFYSFANFVLVNMLIAIIMENFEGGAEGAKHTQQILDFAAQSGYTKEEERKYVLYLTKYLKPYPKSIGVDVIQTGWIHKMRKGLAREFLLGDNELFHGVEKDPILRIDPRAAQQNRRDSSLLNEFSRAPRHGPLNQGEVHDNEHFRNLYSAQAPARESMDDERIKDEPFFSQEAFRHRSLFIFGPKNKARRFLQRFVTPGRGFRYEGARENVMLSRPFNLFITLAILACVIVAAITTPVWRLHQFSLPEDEQSIVIRISDYVFPAIFTVEFFIRVIADGFIFTPDAYLKTLWNQIDFFVLLTLYAPLMANLASSQGVSRFFRSLKALRALRLINQSAYIKGTFHAVLVAGFPQLFDATMLSMALIVPFAIYGMRLFSGLFFKCNDESSDINSINDCTGVFLSPDTNIWMPRVWANPHVYSFDNFGASFLILFEIVSQEGWTGVMDTARNVVGLGLQPNQDASRYNAIFFVLFNLAGGYFVSALFVAIVIENYTKRTGTAFMTANQRRWMDLKKLLGGIKMSKARSKAPANPIRKFFFTVASPKKGWFTRFLTVVTIVNGIVLATEHVNSGDWEGVKNWVFLALLSVYMAEIVFKIGGLGWTGFRKNRWNIYNSVVSICAILITIARLCGSSWQPLIQTQKLFLTAILFRLVQRSDSLNQLFMTMAASIGSISSLLGVWLVVFAVYGIMFGEIFGLTSYGPNGGDHVNFRNIGTSLLMMARMSTGEGWNDLMHDFAVERPNCVNEPDNYLLSDCGSTAWAYTLFISFNIISMYIFTNMFIVVVMHNFSYVYQIAPGFSLITREEIRRYKRHWAEVDHENTGYIQEEDLAKFLMKLRGAFDLRIYNEEHSLAKLQSKLETVKPNAVKLSAKDLEKSTATSNTTKKVLMLNETSRRSTMNREDSQKDLAPGSRRVEQRPNIEYKIHQDYNLDAFNSAIANLDAAEVARRRKTYNFLYTEAVMSMEPIPSSARKKKGLLHWRAPSFGPAAAANRRAAMFEMQEMGGGEEPQEVQMGVSFQKMLIIMAHYKLIEDDQCLSIGDLLRHRQKMDRVHARVNAMNVQRVLLKVILRQRFLKHYRAVRRIQELSTENNGDNDEHGLGAHSSRDSVSTDQTMSPRKKHVRINTGESERDDVAGGRGQGGAGASPSGTRSRGNVVIIEPGKTALEEDESIDPEQAGEMIDSLRTEWRSFISSHDLSSISTELGSQFPMEERGTRTLAEFESVDLGSGTGVARQHGDHRRQDVPGLDYL